jgi:hypothetical protein
MIVEYERTQKDLVEFSLFHIDNSKNIQRQLLLTQIIGGLLIFVAPILFVYTQYSELSMIGFFISLVAGILFYIWYPKYYRSYATKHVKKMLSEGSNKALLGKQTITLSSEGVLSKAQSGESKMLWTSVEKVVQNEKYIFIYMGAINAYVIPKNSFTSLDEQNQFMDFVNKHITQEGKL